MASASSSKRQRLCDTADFVDLCTQQADTGDGLAATQLESENEDHDATPSDGSGQRLTIRERCDRIVAMSAGVNTSEDGEHETIEDFDEEVAGRGWEASPVPSCE